MSALARVRSQDGFTLTELVVAMALGMIILLAAFTIIDRSFITNKAINDREDALQRGRHTLEIMTRAIRSETCVGTVTPIAVAKDNEMDFYAFMGDPTSGSQNPSFYKLVYDPTAKTIRETIYPLTTVTPNPVASATASLDRVLMNNVVPTTAGAPIFSYWAFDTTAPAGSGSVLQLTNTSATTAGLTSSDQGKVVKIVISFLSRPTGVNVSDPHSTTFQDDVFWRASDPESPQAQPCSQGV
jgi:prepilin-type N-terminal cleavage/methylation domain-containing protein